jgi:hypothetical protein
MNRFRSTVFATTLVLGTTGFSTSSALAQAPSIAGAVSRPHYQYQWGYYGWGYYYYPAPSAAVNRGGFYSGPMMATRHAVASPPSAYREPGSGRPVNLAKPWLSPLQ